MVTSPGKLEREGLGEETFDWMWGELSNQLGITGGGPSFALGAFWCIVGWSTGSLVSMPTSLGCENQTSPPYPIRHQKSLVVAKCLIGSKLWLLGKNHQTR